PPHPSPVAHRELLTCIGFAENRLDFGSRFAGDEVTDVIERFVGSGAALRVASQDGHKEDRQSECHFSFHSSFLSSRKWTGVGRPPVRGINCSDRRLGAGPVLGIAIIPAVAGTRTYDSLGSYWTDKFAIAGTAAVIARLRLM